MDIETQHPTVSGMTYTTITKRLDYTYDVIQFYDASGNLKLEILKNIHTNEQFSRYVETPQYRPSAE